MPLLLKRAISVFLVVTGTALFLINIYGLFIDIRKPGLGTTDLHDLRFTSHAPLSYEQSLKAIEELAGQSKVEITEKATKIVQESLTHVRWKAVDSKEYRQLIPIWENYFLYAVGKLSGLPQFERYHFVDYKRSLKRGIGICGDASMILSQVLDQEGIPNRIITFPGHVIVEANFNENQSALFDPDFGVSLQLGLHNVASHPDIVYEQYKREGYSEREISTLVNIYSKPYTPYDSVYNFMAKRFVFEYASYAVKWPLPIIMVIVGIIIFFKTKKDN